MRYVEACAEHLGYYIPTLCCPYCGNEAILLKSWSGGKSYRVNDYSPEPERNLGYHGNDDAWRAWYALGVWLTSSIAYSPYCWINCNSCRLDTGPYADEESADAAWTQLVKLNCIGLNIQQEERMNP